MWASCTFCSEGFSLVVNGYWGDPYKMQGVCVWENEDYRRSLNCMVSDLDTYGACNQCNEGFFYNLDDERCTHCSTWYFGCAICDHEGTECQWCKNGFDYVEGKCIQTQCLSH